MLLGYLCSLNVCGLIFALDLVGYFVDLLCSFSVIECRRIHARVQTLQRDLVHIHYISETSSSRIFNLPHFPRFQYLFLQICENCEYVEYW